MVAQAPVKRQPLVTPALLKQAAAHGTGLDLRGLDFRPWVQPACESKALLRAMAEGLVALQIGPTRWAVSSGSKPGTAYVLDVYQGGKVVRCGCPGGLSGKVCKHAALVRARLPEPAPAVVAKPNGTGRAPVRSLTDLYN